jgi:hypothetical protein
VLRKEVNVLLLQDKESLITELRKELRVSDEEHRELLNKVNEDGAIRRMRYSHKAFEYFKVCRVLLRRHETVLS